MRFYFYTQNFEYYYIVKYYLIIQDKKMTGWRYKLPKFLPKKIDFEKLDM